MSRESSRNFRIKCLRLLAGLLAAGLSFAALAAAQSEPFPTYTPGENLSGMQGPDYPSTLPHPWVVSDGTIITPAGTQVYLGTTTRAKAIALNPKTSTHTAAVLQMGAPQPVTIFNTHSGAVLQNFTYSGSKTGSATGIAYTSDGLHLLFSQDSGYVAYVNVDPGTGMITSNVARISLPLDATITSLPAFGASEPVLNTVNCTQTVTMPGTGVTLPGPVGTSGSYAIPCGVPYSGTTSYPLGIAVSPDNSTAYVVLDASDTLGKINLSTNTLVSQIRVGNVPHSVVISPDGKTAYVSNEAGRIATQNDFQLYSDGTNVVAEYPTGTMARGTISVVNLSTFTVTGSIETGHHPTGMAFWGKYLLVANTYDDSISVIDTTCNREVSKIDLGLPIGVSGDWKPAYGAGPNSIAVDVKNNIAYVALYNANAIAVVDLREEGGHEGWGHEDDRNSVIGMIPVGYAPSSVVLDAADNALLVANDKGIGSTGFQNTPPENSTTTSHGSPAALNTHQDLGIVSIVPVPNSWTLDAMTKQVFRNNHWDLRQNIESASGGNPWAKPVAIPAKIGDPSKIKHVFVIIRENRTYDQMLGDVAAGNGDSSLAVFGSTGIYGNVSPNAHALVERFPLFDNFYDPSRQSADGHNWIMQAMAPYSDDIQSPDWDRDYPSNGGDAIAYQVKGHLYDVAAAAHIKVKNYGEYIEENTFNVPGCTATEYTGSCEPSWQQFYRDSQCFDETTFGSNPNYALPQPSDCAAPGAMGETTLNYQNAVGSYSPLPNVMKPTVQNYPQFDLGIPDQYRFDVWYQDFQNDVKSGSVPQLEFMWISSDHTGGPPAAQAMEADNDLALGRFVDAISHSPVWQDSVIFVEEDDAQDGVDHVDGHRSPGYVFTPYVKQQVNPNGSGAGAVADHTFYTQVNFTRTIEQILGLKPMNQNDLVASPMYEIFTNNPPAANFLPWNHVQNDLPLDEGTTAKLKLPTKDPKVLALQAGWLQKKAEIFAGKYHIPDSEDPDTVRHYNWYEATGFMVPFPGEMTVRPASEFTKAAPTKADQDD
ncbi:MAG: bifunctional YncE family protein/alkaline phosphatase family protein [Terriglobia bacterium]|jgi:YVTN family beta-propeller protein